MGAGSGLPGSERRVADDVLLNHDICRTADKDQMLDIVPAHQQKPAAIVDRGTVHKSDARLAPARLCDPAAHQPFDDEYEQSKQGQNNRQRNDQRQSLRHAFSDLKCVLNPVVHLYLVPSLGAQTGRQRLLLNVFLMTACGVYPQ